MFPWLSTLAYKHMAASGAFMFIQIFASGTSEQNCSVCKFDLWGVTSNRRIFWVHDGRECQSAGLYGLLGILSKHKGMMEKLQRGNSPHTLQHLRLPTPTSTHNSLLNFRSEWKVTPSTYTSRQVFSGLFFLPFLPVPTVRSSRLYRLLTFISEKVTATLSSSRESCGSFRFIEQNGLEGMEATENHSPTPAPRLGAADLCFNTRSTRDSNSMSLCLCLCVFILDSSWSARMSKD